MRVALHLSTTHHSMKLQSSPREQPSDQANPLVEELALVQKAQEEAPSAAEDHTKTQKTASGRVVRRPQRFRDYV